MRWTRSSAPARARQRLDLVAGEEVGLLPRPPKDDAAARLAAAGAPAAELAQHRHHRGDAGPGGAEDDVARVRGVEHEEPVRAGHVHHRPERQRHQELRGLPFGDDPDDEAQDLARRRSARRSSSCGGGWGAAPGASRPDRDRDELAGLEREPGRRAQREGELGDVGGDGLAGDELGGEGGWHRHDDNRVVLASPHADSARARELLCRLTRPRGPAGGRARRRGLQQARGRGQAVERSRPSIRPPRRRAAAAPRARRRARAARARAAARARRAAAAADPGATITGSIVLASAIAKAQPKEGRSTWWRAGRRTTRPRAARSIAVKKLPATTFPLPFTLSAADMPFQNGPFDGELSLTARDRPGRRPDDPPEGRRLRRRCPRFGSARTTSSWRSTRSRRRPSRWRAARRSWAA